MTTSSAAKGAKVVAFAAVGTSATTCPVGVVVPTPVFRKAKNANNTINTTVVIFQNFSGSDLTGADFTESYLRGADLTNAKLCRMNNFSKACMHNTKGYKTEAMLQDELRNRG